LVPRRVELRAREQDPQTPHGQDELYYVSEDHDFEEVVKTLAKQGWTIRSNVDDPKLNPGEFRLEDTAAPSK